MASNRLKIVTYDLEEFVLETNPEYPIRYELRRRVLRDGVTAVYLLRLSGVDHRGNIIEYREKRTFIDVVQDLEKKQWFDEWNEILTKLDARPGRYEW